MPSCLPGVVSRGDGAGGLSVSVTPARGSPGPAATLLLPCVHVTPVFSSCGFCCISGTTGLAAGWGGPRRGPQRETGPAPPCPMVPVRQRPGLRLFRVTQDVVARPPGRVVPPWGAHVRPCSAPQSFRPPSPRSRSRTRRGVSTVPDELGGFSGNVFFTVLLSGCSRWLRVFVWLVRARLPAPRGERSVLGFLLLRREAACRSPSRGGSLPIFPAARSLVFTVLAQCI